MRGSIVFVSLAALAGFTLGCSSSGSSTRGAAPAPAFVSITAAPSTTANAGGWTTPVTETSFSGSPPGPASLQPVGTTARGMPAPQPAPGGMWTQQPPVMEDAPQPPMEDDFTNVPAPPPQMPPADMPAEPTWTPPAPQDAPLPDAPPAADLPGGMPAAADVARYAKPGFEVFERDGLLWVFRENSGALAEFLGSGEPAKSVTSIGSGPGGMSLRSDDMQVIQDFLAAP